MEGEVRGRAVKGRSVIGFVPKVMRERNVFIEVREAEGIVSSC